jgi:hypothetical protein
MLLLLLPDVLPSSAAAAIITFATDVHTAAEACLYCTRECCQHGLLVALPFTGLALLGKVHANLQQQQRQRQRITAVYISCTK